MTRTVKVELEADVAKYLTGVLEADKGTEKLDDKLKVLDKDLDKVTRDAAETGAALGVLGGTAKETGNEVDNLAKKTEESAGKTKNLRTQIDDLEASLKSTGAEFARSGDPELLKKFKTDSSELSGLKSTVREMEKLGVNIRQLGLESEKSEGFFESLKAGFEGGLTSPAGLGIAGVAAGPGLAGIGGLALGGLGFAGAGLGVAGAVMGNPDAFGVAWDDAIGKVKKEFLDAGAAFTGPTLLAIKSIGPLVAGWNLTAALAPAAKYVPMIVDGLEGAATGFEHGFADAVAKAGPDVQVLSEGLTQLGVAGGDALSHIADGAEGGAQALHDIIEGVTLLVEGFGYATEAAEKFYNFLQDHPVEAAIGTGGLSIGASIWANALGNADTAGKTFGKTLDGVALSGELAADAAKSQSTDLASLSQQMNATTLSTDSLAESMSLKLLNSMMSLDQAALGFDTALTRVHDSVKQNGHDLSENTEHGVANRAMILGLVQANIAQYQANMNAHMAADDAAKAYDAGTAAIEKQLKAAGFNQTAIDGMIKKYKEVPDKVDTDIVLNGLTEAINNLDTTLRLINGIKDKSVTVSVTTVYHAVGHPNVGEGGTQLIHPGSAELHGGIRRAADGMIVAPSDPGSVLFGEPATGGEAYIPLKGISQDRAMSIAQVVGDAYGFSVSAHNRSMMAAGWRGAPSGGGAVAVTLAMATGADMTPLGTLFNKMLRDGLIVVKASQVRVG